MNFFHAFKYLEYILTANSKKGFGIHSPFIYDLVSRVLRNKTDDDIVSCIEEIRKNLTRNNNFINVNDLGSGSEKRQNKRRKVSEIARYSAVPPRYGNLLSCLAAEFGDQGIIELGTSLGISTLYMALSSPESIIYTVEGCPESSEIANENFQKAGVTNIKLFTGSFDSVLPLILKSDIKPGLVFIDGNHRKKPVIEYFEKLAGISDNKTVFIFDDIYTSAEMTEAWEIIKQYEKVTVTVDIFRMGIVFFREEITPNNYRIRY